MKTIAVVGAGVIGLSWARLARENDWQVVIYDPREDLDEVVSEFANDPQVRATGVLADAVAGADLVQENGPERLEVKRKIFAEILVAADPTAVLATSSSSISATSIAAELDDASRVVVGHPFNPPELMPLVEVLPGEQTTQEATDRAVELYKELGRVPVVIHKELPGFVANRLQTALSREARYLVQQGVVSAAELDTILQNSLGLRWATIGLFESNVLGGGPGGIRHLFAGVGAETGKIELGVPSADPDVIEDMLEHVESTYGTGNEAFERLREKRDQRTRAVLTALSR
ncbi:3-hydroxyacyl-CoA dehydrogenase NAD-binding domain-containing protein [Rhodococcus sp. G-MC3]|uniref:3-hydroxyacyl-CoA dehydrogenase NAD-binding domain-containing protein n=1 Tax=Rhodococcus sp. G-MC3 TaxID=3046209 RepID=UPI0024BAF039|nr:3-hydroxyacyl-CoA dehydrogenase NAD-binding domain-containing protein [Rhodococcus sp. G-MC3]MDJ0394877.1 3-hydroxyacyl-CoA dehydrogenase NAD-binding domain-containing protein [Rhodococcus sp. G-MC3]